jgi:hypothetical protein
MLNWTLHFHGIIAKCYINQTCHKHKNIMNFNEIGQNFNPKINNHNKMNLITEHTKWKEVINNMEKHEHKDDQS